jgi:hypothetical protein
MDLDQPRVTKSVRENKEEFLMKKVLGATAALGIATISPGFGISDARAASVSEFCGLVDSLASGIEDGSTITCAFDHTPAVTATGYNGGSVPQSQQQNYANGVNYDDYYFNRNLTDGQIRGGSYSTFQYGGRYCEFGTWINRFGSDVDVMKCTAYDPGETPSNWVWNWC